MYKFYFYPLNLLNFVPKTINNFFEQRFDQLPFYKQPQKQFPSNIIKSPDEFLEIKAFPPFPLP